MLRYDVDGIPVSLSVDELIVVTKPYCVPTFLI